MPTKYQVFISSTYTDLKEERDQVIKAVLEMGHIPVGMEMFSAADEQQWKIIQSHIDESDYYAVVIAHRYGSVVDGVSYTRKEYEYAESRKIPVLGFVIDDKAPWPGDRVENDEGMRALLSDFKALVKERPVSFWNSTDDLYGRFSVALSKAITANPREGWVRASTAVGGPQITAEISRLSAENAELRTKLDQAQIDSRSQHAASIAELDTQLGDVKGSYHFRYKTGDREWILSEPISYAEAFDMLAPTLILENTISDIMKTLAMLLAGNFAGEDDPDGQRPPDIVAVNQVQDLMGDWMVLEIVEPSLRKHPISDREEYWTLTGLGRELYMARRKRNLKSRASAPQLADDDAAGSALNASNQRQATDRP